MKEFTLLELTVVMAIIALLYGYISPKYFSELEKSEVKTAKTQINVLEKVPPAEPWGDSYIYRLLIDPAKIDITSYGADDSSGSPDEYADITNKQ